ncbi:hypothetical protein EC991805_1318 [Escherichia coli 99.1805]|nr:hypothetical protein ECTW10119_2008 [Escherichia coli TW10119]EKW00136.1 hypothetical protein EC900091_1763 [Escherichia coli 90.0091]ELV78048.1 hypothetical protein EC991805_1318 [Escherichia coli 99.1805]
MLTPLPACAWAVKALPPALRGKAFNCARKPGVEALARLLAVTAC